MTFSAYQSGSVWGIQRDTDSKVWADPTQPSENHAQWKDPGNLWDFNIHDFGAVQAAKIAYLLNHANDA